MIIQSSPTLLLSDDSNKIENRISSTLLLLTGGGGKITPLSPLDAPDNDFLMWFDFSDNDKLTKNLGHILEVYFTKVKNTPANTMYIEQQSSAPDDTGLINGLQCADFDLNGLHRLEEHPSVPAGYDFAYPSMTIFIMHLRKNNDVQSQELISDYGVDNGVFLVSVGDNTTNFPARIFVRDGSGELLQASTGATVLALDTAYLIVARIDGANKQCQIWLDGGGTNFTGSNSSFDPTYTYEGGDGDGRMAELSQGISNDVFDGYIGSMFITKTALSNADINKYAQWIANKWGTTWVAIP